MVVAGRRTVLGEKEPVEDAERERQDQGRACAGSHAAHEEREGTNRCEHGESDFPFDAYDPSDEEKREWNEVRAVHGRESRRRSRPSSSRLRRRYRKCNAPEGFLEVRNGQPKLRVLSPEVWINRPRDEDAA
jgi:hypothetical protein